MKNKHLEIIKRLQKLKQSDLIIYNNTGNRITYKRKETPRERYLNIQKNRLQCRLSYYRKNEVLDNYVTTLKMFIDTINKELKTYQK